MPVAYIDPVERAWERTRRLLFRPLDAERWLVIGFASFLAGLGGWSTFGWSPEWGYSLSWDDVWNGHRWLLPSLGALTLLGVVLWLVLLWVGSRGKFVFVENLVLGRGAIVAPWRQHASRGNSLFLWRVGLTVAGVLALGVMVSPVVFVGAALDGNDWVAPLGVTAVAAAAVLTVLIAGLAAFVALLLDSFVVPIAFQRGVGTTESWRVLLPLLRGNFIAFVVYGLVILLGTLLLTLGMFVLALATCCMGPLLLSLPYIGAVLLLPVAVLYRYYSLEFLAQFGPEFDLLAVEEVAPETGPAE